MKTLKQLQVDLEKDRDLQARLIDPIREAFFRGEIFNVGDLVESAGVVWRIQFRGTNHLVLEDAEGNTCRKFPHDLTPINEDQYNADFVYSQTLNKDGSRRKNHNHRIEFSNSGIITKSKRVVQDTHRVGQPLLLKPNPIRNPYKNLVKDPDNRRSLKQFVRKLEKAAHPDKVGKKGKRVKSTETVGGAPDVNDNKEGNAQS
jgi:hypothetical protein